MPWVMQSGSAQSARSPGDTSSAWQTTMPVMSQSVQSWPCLDSPRDEERRQLSNSRARVCRLHALQHGALLT